jgi:hypothetical protein
MMPTSTYYLLHDTLVDSISIINYEPNAPAEINVYPITEAEKIGTEAGTHYFDLTTHTIQSKPAEVLQAKQAARAIEVANAEYRRFLADTDWQVLRHIRQQSLGIQTSLSQQEYLDLENQRQQAALSIIQ